MLVHSLVRQIYILYVRLVALRLDKLRILNRRITYLTHHYGWSRRLLVLLDFIWVSCVANLFLLRIIKFLTFQIQAVVYFFNVWPLPQHLVDLHFEILTSIWRRLLILQTNKLLMLFSHIWHLVVEIVILILVLNLNDRLHYID